MVLISKDPMVMQLRHGNSGMATELIPDWFKVCIGMEEELKPLDVDPMSQIEICIVCTERLICT